MKKILSQIIFYFLIFLSATSFADNYAGKKILFVDSYHEGYPWSDGITAGIKNVLEKTGIELKIVRMDTKRNRDEIFKEKSALEAKNIIENFKPDVVIAGDDNASKYLIVPYYKDADLPFVFCGVNWDASIYGFPYKNLTGMVEVALINSIVKHLKNYSKGNTLGLLGIDSLTARKNAEQYAKLLNTTIEHAYFVKDVETWKQQFLKLQNQVDMLILQNPQGIKGWNDEEIVNFVEENTRIPTGTTQAERTIFTLLGIVKVPEEQGVWAAKAALKILDGTLPNDIPIAQNKEGKVIVNLKIGNKLGIVFDRRLLKTAEIIR